MAFRRWDLVGSSRSLETGFRKLSQALLQGRLLLLPDLLLSEQPPWVPTVIARATPALCLPHPAG